MKPVKILLVEDNEGDILLTQEALEESRVSNILNVAKDGSEAINFLEKKGTFSNELMPDLILLDVNLPKKNGHEVLQFVKSNKEFKHIPVIMLTTSSSEKDITLSYSNHANCYITKPVDANEFLAAISKIEDFWINIVQLPINN